MKRVRAETYIPRWDAEGWEAGVYRRYAHKFIQENQWKCANLGLDKDDLLQEAWCCFDFCVKKYKTQSPAHFMSLYKKRLFCQFWLLAKKARKENNRVHDPDEARMALEFKGKHEYNNGPLKILLENAPSEIKDVLNALASAPSELVDELFTKKSITNSDICKILGYDPKKAICKALGYDKDKMQKINLLDIFKEFFA